MTTIPTLRDKKRYIAFEITSEHTITRHEMSEEIHSSIGSLFGDAGASEINAGLVSFEREYGILRCAREKTTQARAALACINKLRGARVSVLVLGISGTIKGAMEKFIQQLPNKDS
ncbi:MAG: ribonuclease P [Candidatus Methanoperedens sp.]|nr:ribonuclease P [Candidatus Methanoperedens sp.]